MSDKKDNFVEIVQLTDRYSQYYFDFQDRVQWCQAQVMFEIRQKMECTHGVLHLLIANGY